MGPRSQIVIPSLGRLRQETFQFKAHLNYILNSKSAWVTKRDHNLKNKMTCPPNST